MHAFTWILISLVLSFTAVSFADQKQPVSIERNDVSLQINIDGRPLATYVWNDAIVRRPYFAHLHAPNGKQASRTHPPVEGRDATDHATMHPGLWLAFGDLSGSDFWRNKGIVKHLEFVEEPQINIGGADFAVRNRYEAGDKLLCEERCRFRIRQQAGGTLIDWVSDFSGPAEFTFGDQEEMGLGVRVATPLTVKNGGRILNSDGHENEKQVWGKQADWCDYRGVIDGEPVGMAIFPSPRNFRRSWFHARDYGVLVANPFGQNAFTKGEKSKIVVSPGKSFRLQFGILLHSGKVDLPAAYQQWLKDSAE